MKVNSKLLGIIVLVTLFGGIALSSALGWWSTENTGGGQGGEGGDASLESELIRGRTTFQDLLNLGLAQETIEEVIGAPMPDPSTRINFYCADRGLDFEVLKEDLEEELVKLDP
jgi:hypothetical protein